eukprot:g2761.t1
MVNNGPVGPSSEFMKVYDASLANPETFWREQALKYVDWYEEPSENMVLDSSNPPFYRWFPNATLNTCYNALDRHIENGLGEQPALIYTSPVTQKSGSIEPVEQLTYNQLRQRVSDLARALDAKGIKKGDRVVIYMPMVPEAIISMLACQRIGAAHSVVFGGFAAKELAVRIEQATPTAVISANFGVEPTRIIDYHPIVNEAINISTHKPCLSIVFQRNIEHELPSVLGTPPSIDPNLNTNSSGNNTNCVDVDYTTLVEEHADKDTIFPCVPVASTDISYLLYTSGTTGVPKGVQRDQGGHATALGWCMDNFMNVKPGDVYWSASDIGWVVGHSFIVYGPLFRGCTTVLFEGKPVLNGNAGVFWDVIERFGVKAFFTAPTALRAIRKTDPLGQEFKKRDCSTLNALYLAGERCDPDTITFYGDLIDRPIVDHFWQTETGWPVAGQALKLQENGRGRMIKPGSTSFPNPGWDCRILNEENGQEMGKNELGAVTFKLPLPPGSLQTLYGNDERYLSAYCEDFPGYYKAGDAGVIDEDGYLSIMARTDDIINVAGHRLSTGQMEQCLTEHASVAECAVIAIKDDLKGELPVGFVVVNDGVSEEDQNTLCDSLIKKVRSDIGAVAAFQRCYLVPALPKTRSGKILRKTIKQIADGEKDVPTPSTIEDEAVLDQIKNQCKEIFGN